MLNFEMTTVPLTPIYQPNTTTDNLPPPIERPLCDDALSLACTKVAEEEFPGTNLRQLVASINESSMITKTKSREHSGLNPKRVTEARKN